MEQTAEVALLVASQQRLQMLRRGNRLGQRRKLAQLVRLLREYLQRLECDGRTRRVP